MKRFLIVAFTLLWGISALAGEPFFCTKAGSKLYYERYKTKTNKMIQTTEFEVDSLVNAGKGKRNVFYGVTMKKNGKRPLFGGRASLVTTLDANGDAHMDFGGSIKAFLQNTFPDAKIKVSGTDGLLPAAIMPGDTLPEAHCKVTVGILVVTVDVTERVVLRREKLTTPAGTFDCVVVRERKKEDAPMHHLDNYLENWYVPNMGYVRHDVYSLDMDLLQSEVLQKIL